MSPRIRPRCPVHRRLPALLLWLGAAVAAAQDVAPSGAAEPDPIALLSSPRAGDLTSLIERSRAYWAGVETVAPTARAARLACEDQWRWLRLDVRRWRTRALALWKLIETRPEPEPGPSTCTPAPCSRLGRKRVKPPFIDWERHPVCDAQAEAVRQTLRQRRDPDFEDRVLAVLAPTVTAPDGPAPAEMCTLLGLWAHGLGHSAWALGAPGDLPHALRLYRLLARRCDAPPDAAFAEADLLEKVGRRAEAAERFERLAERSPRTLPGARAAMRAFENWVELAESLYEAELWPCPAAGPQPPLLVRLTAAGRRAERHGGEDALARIRFDTGFAWYRACRPDPAEPFLEAVAEHHPQHQVSAIAVHVWVNIHFERAERGEPHRLGELMQQYGHLLPEVF